MALRIRPSATSTRSQVSYTSRIRKTGSGCEERWRRSSLEVTSSTRYREAASMDARTHLQSLVGKEIQTMTGQPNRILSVGYEDVVVATSKSPEGKPVPIAWV